MGEYDADFVEPQDPWSRRIDGGIEYVLNLGGYTAARRGGRQGGKGDNKFYRDSADWMPGWCDIGVGGINLSILDPHGHASGATAQDRATNYVGQNDPDSIWNGVRESLILNESRAHSAAVANGGPKAHMSFAQLYQAHVDAYADAEAVGNRARVERGQERAGNTFVDPISFAMAVYGAPLLERAGLDTGPLTGASIDLFNDPTDTVGVGWAKRMGLAAGEIGAGAAAFAGGGFLAASGHPLLGSGSMAGGLGMMGVGAASGIWNTATAIGAGMGLHDAVRGIGQVGSSLLKIGAHVATDARHALFGSSEPSTHLPLAGPA